MNPRPRKRSFILRFRPSYVDKSSISTHIRVPSHVISSETTSSSKLKLISKHVGEWNLFESIKCIICWQPIDIHGKDANSFIECPHCHQKAHQDHMLRWLAKKKHCPYCLGKL